LAQREVRESVYRLLYALRVGLLAGAIAYCTLVVLQAVGLGSPPPGSPGEYVRLLTLGGTVGLGVFLFVLTERRLREPGKF